MKKLSLRILFSAIAKNKVPLLAIASMLPFLTVIISDNFILAARDISRVYLPYKYFLSQSFHKFHTIPFWDHLSFSGFPYHADPNYGLFHPGNILFFLIPLSHFFQAYALFTAIHIPVIFLGMFYLLRDLNIEEGASLLIAIIAAWCGVSISSFCTVNILASYVCLPWFLLFLLRYLREYSEKNAFLLSAAIFFPTLAGDPQFSYGMTVIYFCSSFQMFRSPNPILKKIYLFILPLALSGLAASVQLIPTLTWIKDTERTANTIIDAQLYSIHPIRLFDWLLPQPFGNYLPEHTYWGGKYIGRIFKQPFVFSFYPGALAVFLLFSHFIRIFYRIIKKKIIDKNNLIFLFTLIVFSLISMGENLPISLYEIAYYLLPGFSLFRYPERFVFAISILVCILIAFEISHYLSGWNSYKKFIPKAFLGSIFIFTISFYFWSKANSLETQTFSTAFFRFSLALVLNFFFLFILHLKYAKNSQTFLLAGLTLISASELFFHANHLIWKSPKNITSNEENIVSKKIVDDLQKREAEINRGSAFRFTGGLVNPDRLRATVPQKELDIVSFITKLDWLVSKPHVNHYFNLATPAGYGSLNPKQTNVFWVGMSRSNPQALMNLFSIYYFAVLGNDNQLEVRVNTEAIPYLRSVQEIEYQPNLEAVEMKLLTLPQISKTTPLILETPITGTFAPLEIVSVEKKPDILRIKAQPLNSDSKQALMAWNESYDKGWKAKVNGVETPILRANGWSSALLIPLTSGNKPLDIVFTYSNPWLNAGIFLSALWLLLGICFFALNFSLIKKNKI